MREPLRDKERLAHMLAAVERVIRYTSGKTFDDLKADDMPSLRTLRLSARLPISFLLSLLNLILKRLGSRSEACVITLFTSISRLMMWLSGTLSQPTFQSCARRLSSILRYLIIIPKVHRRKHSSLPLFFEALYQEF